jgi:hypothetical protein
MVVLIMKIDRILVSISKVLLQIRQKLKQRVLQLIKNNNHKIVKFLQIKDNRHQVQPLLMLREGLLCRIHIQLMMKDFIIMILI